MVSTAGAGWTDNLSGPPEVHNSICVKRHKLRNVAR